MASIRTPRRMGAAGLIVCTALRVTTTLAADAAPVRVACVGDSITDFNTYEPHLQQMLAAEYPLADRRPGRYEVLNFGVSGKTALDLDASYMQTPKYQAALASKPDIVLIVLGTNDSRTGNTYRKIDQFVADYTRLARSFLDLPTKPRVYLCEPTTMPNEGHWGDNDLNLVTGVIPRINDVARALRLPVIDLHTPTFGRPEWVSDNVHPSGNTAGRVMAAQMYRAIVGLTPPAALYPAVAFAPTTNLLAKAELKAGGTLDVRAALEANGPGDYFLGARVRLAAVAAGSPAAALTLTLTDAKGTTAVRSEPVSVCTRVWADTRAVKPVAWIAPLKAATLAVAMEKGATGELTVESVVLQKYPYPAPSGRPAAPAHQRAEAAGDDCITVRWTDNANDWTPGGNERNETNVEVEWAADRGFTRNRATARAPADVNEFAVSKLKPGTTYYFRVRALNAAGDSAWSNTADATTAGPAAGPAAPEGLALGEVAGRSVALTWVDRADGEAGYRVEWATAPDFTSCMGFEDIAANRGGHTVTGLLPSSTYAFRVRALGKSSDSAPSKAVQKVTWRATPEGRAERLTATAAGEGTVRLTWADDCAGETGYRIHYAGDEAFTQQATSMLAKAASEVTVTGLQPGLRYYFRVCPVNAIGSGDNLANPPVVTGTCSDVVFVNLPPAAPAEVTAWVHSSAEVRLQWRDVAANETAYRVERAAEPTFAGDVVSQDLPANTTNFVADGLDAGVAYAFRVRAISAGGPSTNAAAVVVRTPAAGTPATPGVLQLGGVTSDWVELSWADNSRDEAGFHVERAADDGFTNGIESVDLAANTTRTRVTGLTPDTAYCFRVRAYNRAGPSAASPTVAVTTLPLPPAAPGPLALAAACEDAVTVTWADRSDNEEGFLIERAADIGFSREAITGRVGAATISFDVAPLAPGTTYYFRAWAQNRGGRSAVTDPLNVTTPAPARPAAPGDLSATGVAADQVVLFWTDRSANEQKFVVDRATDGSFARDVISSELPAGTTRHAVTGLAPGTEYVFRVRAANATGDSPVSGLARARTLASAPSAYEGFDGQPGAALDGLAGGSGWAGAWKARPDFRIEAGSLCYTDRHQVSLVTGGHRLVLQPEGDYREAARSLILFAERMRAGGALDVWFSCLLKPAGSRDFNPWAAEAYNTGPVAQGASRVTYSSGSAWEGGSPTAKEAPVVALTNGAVNLLICNLVVPADRRAFTWTWYVNPSSLADPQGTAVKTVWTERNETGKLRGLTGFGVRNRPDSRGGFELDELRYGDSAAAVVPALAAPGAPTGLRAEAAGQNRISLTWKDASDNEAGFAVERATDEAFTRNVVRTFAAPGSEKLTVEGLASGAGYYFRIRAVNAAGESAFTPAVGENLGQ